MTKEDKKWLKIGGGVVAAIALFKVLSPKTDTSSNNYDPTGNGGGRSSGTFNADIVAEKLYDAMKESGTDEASIVKALTPVNAQQFGQVVAAFKNRSYNELLGNQIRLSPFSALPLKNLPFWLKKELSATRYSILRAKYPNHL